MAKSTKSKSSRKPKTKTLKSTQQTKGTKFLTHHSTKKNPKPQQVRIAQYKRCIAGTHHVVPTHWRSNPYGGKKTAPRRKSR